MQNRGDVTTQLVQTRLESEAMHWRFDWRAISSRRTSNRTDTNWNCLKHRIRALSLEFWLMVTRTEVHSFQIAKFGTKVSKA